MAKKIISLFFVLLGIGILLGDGKQPVVEIYGAILVILLWVLHRWLGFVARPLPHPFLFPWIAIGVVAIVSTVFSDSIGYSVSWIVRLASGYLVFRLFYTIASDNSAKVFSFGLLFLRCGLHL